MKLTRGLSFSIVASACLLLPILFAAPADAQVITFIQICDREQECPASDSASCEFLKEGRRLSSTPITIPCRGHF